MKSGIGRASCLVALAVIGGCARGQARDVVLVATGMSFALASEPEAVNPALAFRPGERVRLTLKNEAPGLRHDVAIPAWDVATEQVGFGETAQVTFTVPATGGPVDYYCRPHATMMRGLVTVAPIAERARASSPDATRIPWLVGSVFWSAPRTWTAMRTIATTKFIFRPA